mgnify:CR=1 FL=1
MAVLVDGHLNPDRLDLIQAQREIEPLLKIYRRLRKAHPFDGSLDIIRAFIAVLSKKFNVDGFPHPHGVHKSPIQIKKHYLFIFQKILYHKFSKRTGTPAAAMPNQVPEDVVKNRFDRLLREVQDIAAEVVKRHEGTVQKVLVEEIDTHEAGFVTGRLSNNTVVHFAGDASLIGKIVDVSLDEAKGILLYGISCKIR